MSTIKPNTSNLKNKNRTDCVFNWLLGMAILISLVTVGSCGFVFYHTCVLHTSHKDCDHQWMALRDSIYSDAIHTDTIFKTQITQTHIIGNAHPDKQLDSLKSKYLISYKDFELIKNAQKGLIVRQDKLADDLRQESNNLINKTNGWLGFWIGIMSILGVFVPIALQFKLYRDARDKEEKTNQAIKTILTNNKSEFEQQKSNIEKKIGEIEDYKKKATDYLSKEISQLNRIQSTALAKSFQSIAECPEINTNNNRDTLLAENWREMIEVFSKFICDYRLDKPIFANSYSISVILLQIISSLAIIRTLNPRRSRSVKRLKDMACLLIKSLNETGANKQEILHSLQNFYHSLLNFHPFPI